MFRMSLAQAVGDNRFKKTAVNGGHGKKGMETSIVSSLVYVTIRFVVSRGTGDKLERVGKAARLARVIYWSFICSGCRRRKPQATKDSKKLLLMVATETKK